MWEILILTVSFMINISGSTHMLDHVWEQLVIRMLIFMAGNCSLCIEY